MYKAVRRSDVNSPQRIFVAGHGGMVGSALLRALSNRGDALLLVGDRKQLNLLDQQQVQCWFNEHEVDQVYLAAARVGGIHANSTYPADFIYENLVIQNNVISAAHLAGVHKLLFLGSSCIYPKLAEQPIVESALLCGPLEPTNEPYAIAKIAGIKLCESYNRQYGRDYRSVMPTNLYGPNDNFHPENSHVIPALLRRFHEAKQRGDEEVLAWGTGSPRREFLHVDDMAAACIHIMNVDKAMYDEQTSPMSSHINVGTGRDCTIKALTEIIAEVVGFNGRIIWDESKPDGTPRKQLDVSRLHGLGWRASIGLREGLEDTYRWFASHEDKLRSR